MPREDLSEKIREFLTSNPGSKAREIAVGLGVESSAVNSVLYGQLSGEVRQDDRYQWFLSEGAGPGEAGSRTTEFADTHLAKLARYYLACLGQEERGVSVFASSRHSLDYAELPVLPTRGDIFSSRDAQDLLGRSRREIGRMELFFGYPVLLRHQRSQRTGWKGYFVEPLFLFSVELEGDSEGPSVDLGFPIINQKVMSQLAGANRDQVMTAILDLEEDLGLVEAEDPPELEDMALRLASRRRDWPWQEEIDPAELGSDPPLRAADSPGFFNRAVLVMAERPPFTKGLETELKQLARLRESEVAETALGDWLGGTTSSTVRSTRPLPLEVLPLNTEQREAIQSAFTKKLTVVTGPPGTGKSQVVTNLLVTAAWEGKRVLFASKNNKAVDVVEARVNELGPRPILLRLGANQYQTKLAEYLIALLSTQTTPEDRQAYEEARRAHHDLTSRLHHLDEKGQEVVKLRNRVDSLERAAETARSCLPQEFFASLKGLELTRHREAEGNLRKAVRRADPGSVSRLFRLFWFMVGPGRRSSLDQYGRRISDLVAELGLAIPTESTGRDHHGEWAQVHKELQRRVAAAGKAREYLVALDQLQRATPLEAIAREKAKRLEQLSQNAHRLWKSWLRVQPGNLAASDRQRLSQYRATLRMVLDTPAGDRLQREVYRAYQKAAESLGHLMPCWAVTSLSARGRIPLKPGHFDLVVFDEASQCDIASALPLLFRAKQAVVIGDPKQLSHISQVPRGQDQRLLETYGLLQGHGEWAYSYQSLFDLAAGLVPPEGLVNLRDHHRSDADIIGFSNEYFYEGRLRVATRHGALKRLAPDEPGVRWIDVPGRAERPGSSGARNDAEVEATLAFLEGLVLQQGYSGTVGVVTPFRAQANRIQEAMSRNTQLADELLRRDFLADTVHKFQGDERDLMVFSPVVASGLPDGALRFLEKNGNLFNVAITRARGALVVVGDFQACLQCSVEYLSAFAAYCRELTRREAEALRREERDLGPEYPAVSNPEQVSDWERILYRALFRAGVRAVPQFRVENYSLDFAVFVGDRRLDVEVDGERYHRNWTGELCRRDELRNQRLFELGWDVIRFWVYEVRDDLDGCVRRVKRWVALAEHQEGRPEREDLNPPEAETP